MLVADDYHLEAGGEEYRSPLMTFFIIGSIVGVPLSWNKTSGGATVTWVGFELLHRTRQLGISRRRADWFRRWTTEVASSSSVHVASSEEGLGRVMYVAGPLEHQNPFLGPLHKFMSLHPQDSVRAVPPCVSFFLRYLAEQISQCRHHDSSVKLFADQVAPRFDAQGSSTRTGIGGWLLQVDETWKIDVKASRWFSLEITEEKVALDLRERFQTGGHHFTLEALAVVVALKANNGEVPGATRSRVRVVPTTTDYRGNGAALNKLMTTRNPASAVLMELAA